MVSRLFLLVLLSCCLSVDASGSRINIVNNGYRDIVVAISPDVLPDEADDLLDNIQVIITY
jgi:calcium-activated chloride channel regulator 4